MNLQCHETLIPHTYIYTYCFYKNLILQNVLQLLYIYIFCSSNTLHYGTYRITDVFYNICSAVCTKRWLWEVNCIRCTTGMCKSVNSMEVKGRNWPCFNAKAGQSQLVNVTE